MVNFVSQTAEPRAAPHPAGRLYCSAAEAGAAPTLPRRRSGRAFYGALGACAAAHLCVLTAILRAPASPDALAGEETAFEIIVSRPAPALASARSWRPGEHAQEVANVRRADVPSKQSPKLETAPTFAPVAASLVATASRAQMVRAAVADLAAPRVRTFDKTELALTASFAPTVAAGSRRLSPQEARPQPPSLSAPERSVETPLRAPIGRPEYRVNGPALRVAQTSPSAPPRPLEAQRAAEQVSAAQAQAAERARALAVKRTQAVERAKAQAAERAQAAIADRREMQRQLAAQRKREQAAEQRRLAAQKLAAQELAAQQEKAAEQAKLKRAQEEEQRTKAAQDARERRAAVAYRALVSGRIAARERYPQAAMQRFASGVARVRLEIAASGAIKSAAIQTSSGDATLDAAALQAVRRAGPFPAPPPGAVRVYVAPVAFRPS